MQAMLDRVLPAMRWDDVGPRLLAQFDREHKEYLPGLMADAVAPITPETVFARRRGVRATVTVDGDALALSVDGRTTRWPGAVAPMLRAALGFEGPFRMADLGPDLDDKGKVTLLRRLLGEGAVAVAR